MEIRVFDIKIYYHPLIMSINNNKDFIIICLKDYKLNYLFC